MFCRKCGTENSAGNAFCPKCGEKFDTITSETTNTAPVTETPVSEQPVYVESTPASYSEPAEKNTALWLVLGLFVPIVGIILFFVWLKKKPQSSKNSLIGAIIGIVISILLTVLLFALGFLSLGSLMSIDPGYDNPTIDSPVINKPVEKKTYKVGDAVTTVDGSKWHIIGVSGDNVTLLLDELVVEETGYGNSASAEDQKYVNSKVKKYIDETYKPEITSKIDNAGGDSSNVVVRIMSMDDYLDITKQKFADNYLSTSYTVAAYDDVDQVCKMMDILALTKSFWTSSNVRDYNSSSSYFGVLYIKRADQKFDYFCNKTMYETYAIIDTSSDSAYQMGATFIGIRPVIETPTSNLK